MHPWGVSLPPLVILVRCFYACARTAPQELQPRAFWPLDAPGGTSSVLHVHCLCLSHHYIIHFLFNKFHADYRRCLATTGSINQVVEASSTAITRAIIATTVLPWFLWTNSLAPTRTVVAGKTKNRPIRRQSRENKSERTGGLANMAKVVLREFGTLMWVLRTCTSACLCKSVQVPSVRKLCMHSNEHAMHAVAPSNSMVNA